MPGTRSCSSSTSASLPMPAARHQRSTTPGSGTRQGLFYPYSAWSFTIGRAFYQPRMQPDEISLACIKRVAAAIDDHNSFDAVGL